MLLMLSLASCATLVRAEWRIRFEKHAVLGRDPTVFVDSTGMVVAGAKPMDLNAAYCGRLSADDLDSLDGLRKGSYLRSKMVVENCSFGVSPDIGRFLKKLNDLQDYATSICQIGEKRGA